MPNGIARDRQHKPVGEGRREENSLTPPEAHMRRGPPKGGEGTHGEKEGKTNQRGKKGNRKKRDYSWQRARDGVA